MDQKDGSRDEGGNPVTVSNICPCAKSFADNLPAEASGIIAISIRGCIYY